MSPEVSDLLKRALSLPSMNAPPRPTLSSTAYITQMIRQTTKPTIL